MPKVKANGITLSYEQQGTGEPLVLIPKHFTCISVDPRGAGESD